VSLLLILKLSDLKYLPVVIDLQLKLLLSFILIIREAFAADPPGESHVLTHNRDSPSVNGTQIGVFEYADYVGLGCLLKCLQGGRLHSVARDYAIDYGLDHTVKRGLKQEAVSSFLILLDLSDGDSAWPESVYPASLSVGLLMVPAFTFLALLTLGDLPTFLSRVIGSSIFAGLI